MTNGSCLCGKIKFTLSGAVTNMSHCHCSICRKIHGSLFATYLEATVLSYSSGEDAIQHYLSSKGFNRAFCKDCGSVLPEASDQDGHTAYYIPAGILDDDPGIRPESHIFCESKSAAYRICDDLPQMTHYGDGDLSRVVEVTKSIDVAGRVTGGCLCGDVAFDYEGVPKFMMNCHCSRCRKAKGAAHATNVFVPSDQFRWIKGQDKVTVYDHASAKSFGHAFCKCCGSSAPRKSMSTGLLNIPAGSLNGEPGITARGHIFVSSRAPWFEISDDLPQWNETPD